MSHSSAWVSTISNISSTWLKAQRGLSLTSHISLEKWTHYKVVTLIFNPYLFFYWFVFFTGSSISCKRPLHFGHHIIASTRRIVWCNDIDYIETSLKDHLKTQVMTRHFRREAYFPVPWIINKLITRRRKRGLITPISKTIHTEMKDTNQSLVS